VISRRFEQTAKVEPLVGENARGPVFGPAVTVPCRVQEADSYKRGRDGSADRHEVTDSTVLYMPFTTDCPPRSRVTLPSGDVGTAVEAHRHAVPVRLRHLKVVVR
jgi:hypothetical protein